MLIPHDPVGRNHLIGYTTTMLALDIAIAGCGPCGLAAALLLHRAEHHVTLFDRLFGNPLPRLDLDSDPPTGTFLVEAA